MDRAVRAAREAFEDKRWSGIAAAERTRAMLAFADAVDAHADELAELESLDNGKPVKMARRVDVPLTSAHLRYFAGWPTRINGEVLPVASRTCTATPARSRWAWRVRSSRGTSRS